MVRNDINKHNINSEVADKFCELRDSLRGSGLCGRVLEVYLVRILFCFFADAGGIFEPDLFVNYILQNTDADGKNLALQLNIIFETLNTPDYKRYSTIDSQLNKFPYIANGLFTERFGVTEFCVEVREVLVECCFFDWIKISPSVLGEIFQGMMNGDERRKFGVHYTSDENIMKLISPLFLDGLRSEFYCYKQLRSDVRERLLLEFQDKLSRLKFLDPACGCGNFLVVCYRELRMLEAAVLHEIFAGKSETDISGHIKVNVGQFYGIEASEFPAKIAQIAMLLMDNQMNKLAGKISGQSFKRTILGGFVLISCVNAFEVDWGEIVTKKELNYILGNPPFLGARLMNMQQRTELSREFCNMKKCRELDYVAAWFKKAAVFIRGTDIEVAFVSTNSICQGSQVAVLWRELMEADGVKINFAHRTFKWSGAGEGDAAVYCVIVGFGVVARGEKRLFLYENVRGEAKEMRVKRINAYLTDAEDVFIESRQFPICDVPKINFGNQPIDGGFLLLTPEERERAIRDEPAVEKFIRRYVGGHEFLNNILRYCLWLEGAELEELEVSFFISQRLELVRNFRAGSLRSETRKLAETPSRFAFVSHNGNSYIIIPGVSSEIREYLPIGFMGGDVIASNACLVMLDGTLYYFAVLMSKMHNVWMRYVCGRLEMRYRYSATVVYNNFPFPDKPTDNLVKKIEEVAQEILDIRARFSNKSIAELYSPLMPVVLLEAHCKLDMLIDSIYGQNFNNDADRMSFLFELYQNKRSQNIKD
ncbi:MAG: N-6 DNA methylase [Planctomycetaceae bacterium]|jgi:hypothetical protein|nr:N-6 DNA methylase [Planctomycetaceae bacterium]